MSFNDLINQTFVRVAGAIIAACILGFFTWLWKRPAERERVALTINTVTIDPRVLSILILEYSELVAKKLISRFDLKDGDRDIPQESLDLSLNLALEGGVLSKSKRLEELYIENLTNAPVKIHFENLGAGTVFLSRHGVELEKHVGPFRQEYQIPPDTYLEAFHFSPVANCDRVTGSSRLIIVEEGGQSVPVRNRRYDREHPAAARYLRNSKRARALFIALEIAEVVILVSLACALVIIVTLSMSSIMSGN
ncbi:hypothetical protein [Rhodovulum sp. 12E13]|uniref:hypothetical protein n=1 Tax=Rhodovulum sp. 12E13 TaxID=2203891 RepID=UPI0011C02B79|nr:hypothetical protein [Rhodovulum sp. 12E13]